MRPETALLLLEWSHIVLWAVLASCLAWPLVREWWQERRPPRGGARRSP